MRRYIGMTKREMINFICETYGKLANRRHLNTLSGPELCDVYDRARAMGQVTQAEINLHCQM